VADRPDLLREVPARAAQATKSAPEETDTYVEFLALKQLREQLQIEIKHLHERLGVTNGLRHPRPE